jgi:uncharacterized protein YggE
MPAILLVVLALYSGFADAGVDDRSITVFAEGHVEAVPDTLKLTVSVRQLGRDLGGVQRQVDKLTTDVVEAARKAGVEEEDIDSAQLNAWPEYEWRRDERHYLGEAVQRDITMRIRELDDYGKLMQALTEIPLHRINRPSLSHSNRAELQLEAIRAAMERGRVKAATIAAEAGGQLGDVLSVVEGGGTMPAPRPAMMTEAMRSDGGGEPSFNFARQRISANLEIRFALQ